MKYIDKPYGDRQYLMVVEDDRGTANEAIDIFRKSELPKGVNFIGCSVRKNELYIAHPSLKGAYIPYAQHEMAFFQDKIHELSILLQALGAEEIKISWVKGIRIEDFKKSSFDLNGGVSAGKYGGGSGSYSTMNSSAKKNSADRAIMLTITSDSVQEPYVPEDLHWYHNEPTWARMVQQRKMGMKTYSIQVSSKSSSESSTVDSESLKAALRVLFVKLKVQVNETIEKLFKEDEETIWKVDVKFKPLSFYGHSYADATSKSNSAKSSQKKDVHKNIDAEDSYRNSCLKLIKSKDVSETIAIELNRLRTKLNISVEVAEKIEQDIKSSIKVPWYKKLFG